MNNIVWLVLLIAFILIEAMTVNLTTIWFAGGAFVALIFSLCGIGLFGQVATFLVVTILLLVFTKPIVQQHFNNKLTPTNIDATIGKQAMVTEQIDNIHETGAVQVDGLTWTARAMSDEIIQVGTIVEVVEVKGVKLFVRPIQTTKS